MRILLARASALPDLYWGISQGERVQIPGLCRKHGMSDIRFVVDHLAVLVALACWRQFPASRRGWHTKE